MGYSLPAGLGAAIAKPRRQVVPCGDGAVQMSMCELGTVTARATRRSKSSYSTTRIGMVRIAG
ncbi:MAG: thiamine pyrophosphate-dependent enzyme [Christensenellales bacterium]